MGRRSLGLWGSVVCMVSAVSLLKSALASTAQSWPLVLLKDYRRYVHVCVSNKFKCCNSVPCISAALLNNGRGLCSDKTLSILAVSEVIFLIQMGVAAVIAMVQWGKDHSVFPDETMLAIARHLSKLGVSLVLGQHSRQLAQGHAYFGKTLVIFSPGCFITADSKSASCWNKVKLGFFCLFFFSVDHTCHACSRD